MYTTMATRSLFIPYSTKSITHTWLSIQPYPSVYFVIRLHPSLYLTVMTRFAYLTVHSALDNNIQSSHNTPCISRAKIKAFVGPYFSLEDNQITVANSIANAIAQINETVPKVIILITLLIISRKKKSPCGLNVYQLYKSYRYPQFQQRIVNC